TATRRTTGRWTVACRAPRPGLVDVTRSRTVIFRNRRPGRAVRPSVRAGARRLYGVAGPLLESRRLLERRGWLLEPRRLLERRGWLLEPSGWLRLLPRELERPVRHPRRLATEDPRLRGPSASAVPAGIVAGTGVPRPATALGPRSETPGGESAEPLE